MPRRILPLLLALSGLLFSSSALAICAKPDYPAQSMQLAQEGVAVIGLRLRTDGTVSATIVLHSSGFPALDQSAQRRLSGCVFTPPDDSSLWDGIWLQVRYNFFSSTIIHSRGAPRARSSARWNRAMLTHTITSA